MASPEIYTYNKTFQERLDECMDVLCTRGVKVPASVVINEWRFYIYQVIEPCGWQALWKLSRVSCDKFCVKYPTFVFVEVLSSDLHILCATVNILAVQDDFNLPDQVQVPLQHLYPTKQQTNNVLNIDDTANCIDQLRFFYDHLWQPWDIDDDENADWPSEHLESRIQLHYDMRSGVVLRETGEHIRALLDEGRAVQSRIATLEDAMSDNEDEEIDEADDATLNLMELNLRKERIKAELQMLENPVMRNLFMRKRQQIASSKRGPTGDNSKEVCFVWLGGTMDDFIKCLKRAKLLISQDAFIRSASLLQEALDQAVCGDTIVLCPGVHAVRGSGALEGGGLVRGTCGPGQTSLSARHSFSCCLAVLTLEDLTVDCRPAQTALLARGGILRLLRCRVVGDGGDCQGALVLPGARLEAQSCSFARLGTAVVIDAGGEAHLTDCTIAECSVGLQLYDGSSVDLKSCKINNCKEGGIRIETSVQNEMGECTNAGSLALLDGLSKIKVADTTLENNADGDVLIARSDAGVFCESLDFGCLIDGVQNDEGVPPAVGPPLPAPQQESMVLGK